MTGKYLAALAVSGILTVALPISAGIQDSKAVELAGADEEDEVTIDQLLESGRVKLPAPYLKIAETKSTLSAKLVKQTLTRPNPELQLEKHIAKSAPKPEENLVEPTEKEIVRKPKPAEPVKKAAEFVPKEEPKETLDAQKKWCPSRINQPLLRLTSEWTSAMILS